MHQLENKQVRDVDASATLTYHGTRAPIKETEKYKVSWQTGTLKRVEGEEGCIYFNVHQLVRMCIK